MYLGHSPPYVLGPPLLKALWGGHTAALHFMLGMQLQVGESKHAMRDRRFARGRHHEDMHAIYLAGSVSYTYLCDVGFKNCKSKSELGHHQKYEKYEKAIRMFDATWQQWLRNLQKCTHDACGRFC